MELRTLQGLLVVGALAWGIFPVYGAGAFGAALALVLVAYAIASRRARRAVRSADTLAQELSAAALTWVSKHALFYVRPKDAERWATTFQLGALLMLFVAPALVLQGLIFLRFHLLAMLIPAVAVFALVSRLSGRLVVEGHAEGPWLKQRALHEEARKVLAARELAGQWPPPK